MIETDLLILCNVLIASNTKSSIINRSLLTLQWHVLGIDDLRYVNYKNNLTCVAVNMSRMKVHIQHDVHVFVHKERWQVCPVHSLVSLILVTGASEFVFKHVLNRRSITHHVNDLLRQLYDEWETIEDEANEKVFNNYN